jgi:putative N6-adenine-specific DNA methylase
MKCLFRLSFLLSWTVVINLFPVTTCFVASSSSCYRSQRTTSSFRWETASSASASSQQQQQDDSIADSSSNSYLATCIPGLAPVLAQELELIHKDITDIQQSGNSAVTFTATREASLHALIWVRTAHRLLELVANSPETSLLYDKNDVHEFIRQDVNVKDLLGDGEGGLLTISCKAVLNNARNLPKDLSHSHFTGLTIKNALCDVVRELRSDRPNVELDDPDVPLVAMVLGHEGAGGNGASISLYKSLAPPGSLHKRGYRRNSAMHKAAMKESLAAGLLLQAGWREKAEQAKAKASQNNNNHPLIVVDPMAGSGSLVLEAAMMAADIAPALMRIKCGMSGQSLPPVTRWKGSIDSTRVWKELLLEANQRAKQGIQTVKETKWIQIHANDIHGGALDLMEDSLAQAGLSPLVQITNHDCKDLKIPSASSDSSETTTTTPHYWVLTNPPWGVRLTEDVEESWDSLRHFLRDTCPSETEAWVLSGDKAASAQLKMKRDRMIPIQTGDQHLRWIQYTIRAPQERKEQHEEDGQETRNVDGVPKPRVRVALKQELPKPRPARSVAGRGGGSRGSPNKFKPRPQGTTKKASANEWLID